MIQNPATKFAVGDKSSVVFVCDVVPGYPVRAPVSTLAIATSFVITALR